MSEKINGELAAELYMKGKNIQLLNVANDWIDADENIRISFFRLYKDDLIFRVKPSFIVVNGREVPAPVKDPIPGKEYFCINGSKQDGYERVQYDNSNFVFTLGCWEYEKDILKVVAAFNKSFEEFC